MWEYIGVQAYSITWTPEMQESNFIVRRLWHGSACILDLAIRRVNVRQIWGKFEEFCKSQSNEVWGHFDLLTSFRQGNCNIDEGYNAVQAQVNLAKYPPENAEILHRDIFWLFVWDEEFVSRTISDGSVDLDKFFCKQSVPACKKDGEERSSVKPKQSNHKQHGSESYQLQNQHKKQFDAKSTHQSKDRCSKCGDTAHIEGFQCPAKKYQCKACHKFGHFTSLYFQKKQASSKPRRPKVH